MMVKSIMEFTDESKTEAVYFALGAASVCWDQDGVFMDQRAAQIAEELIAYLGIVDEEV